MQPSERGRGEDRRSQSSWWECKSENRGKEAREDTGSVL